MQALQELETRSLNKSAIEKSNSSISIAFVNAQNLVYHFQDVQSDYSLNRKNLILLAETRIPNNVTSEEISQYSLKNYTTNHCSMGPEKGMFGYSDETIHLACSISKPTCQMMKDELYFLHKTKQMVKCDVIRLYRSDNSSNVECLVNDLMNLIDNSKMCIILGDFNICMSKNPNNRITSALLGNHFTSSVDFPTDVRGGKMVDVDVIPGFHFFANILSTVGLTKQIHKTTSIRNIFHDFLIPIFVIFSTSC